MTAKGIPADQVRATTWGIHVEVAGIEVQPVECHHWSQIQLPNGTLASGNPVAFVVYADPSVRFNHYGDTAIFSDLKLIAELYRPTFGCIGISQPWEITPWVSRAGRFLTGEMSPREGALAAQWLGLETVLPCHYILPDNEDMWAFDGFLDKAREQGQRAPKAVMMASREVLTVRWSKLIKGSTQMT